MHAVTTGDDLVEAVRGGDYQRFLAIQLAPAEKRAALYAIVAFHIEIASVAEIVSEALIGHIRLAWWCEALEEIEAGKLPRNHPVVLALAEVYGAHPAVFALLQEMIEARAADLDTSLIAEEKEWRDYCNHTAGALHMAIAMVLNEPCARAEESLIRDGGMAYAMIGLARAIPFMAAHGWLRFPHTWMDAHHLTTLAPSESLNQLVQQITRTAHPLMNQLAYNQKLRVLSALVALAALGERQLQRVSYDPYRLRQHNCRLFGRYCEKSIDCLHFFDCIRNFCYVALTQHEEVA